MPPLETGLETVANLVAHSRGDLMLLLELPGWEIPPGISAEKLAPRPGTTSKVKWVCFQYSN